MSDRFTFIVDRQPERLKGGHKSVEVLTLALQMQSLVLAVEELRLRLVRIEQHLNLDAEAAASRADLGKLERIWRS